MEVGSSGRKLLLVALAVLGAIAAGRAYAVPVIPDAGSIGISTPAGRRRHGLSRFQRASSRREGTGWMKACIDATGPRTCIFEVVRRHRAHRRHRPSATEGARLPPSPERAIAGIMIRGAALRIHASDILIQHLRLRVATMPNGPILPTATRSRSKVPGRSR